MWCHDIHQWCIHQCQAFRLHDPYRSYDKDLHTAANLHSVWELSEFVAPGKSTGWPATLLLAVTGLSSLFVKLGGKYVVF